MVTFIISIIASLLLKIVNVEIVLLVGLLSFDCMMLALSYMKKFGLRPNEYNKEDIEFKA